MVKSKTLKVRVQHVRLLALYATSALLLLLPLTAANSASVSNNIDGSSTFNPMTVAPVALTIAAPEGPVGRALSVDDPTCPTPSPGDLANGITIVCDTRCLTKGIVGCIPNRACRFCAKTVTDKSQHLATCDGSTTFAPATVGLTPTTAAPVATTAAPVATTAAPVATTAAPVVPTPTTATPEGPVGGTLSVDDPTCPTPSPGDLANGITIVCDTRCLTKGIVGCIPNRACRFCAKTVTDKSQHLATCDGSTTFAPKVIVSPLVMAKVTSATEVQQIESLSPFEYVVAGAAAVGVAVIVVLLVFGVRRAAVQLRTVLRVETDDVGVA